MRLVPPYDLLSVPVKRLGCALKFNSTCYLEAGNRPVRNPRRNINRSNLLRFLNRLRIVYFR